MDAGAGGGFPEPAVDPARARRAKLLSAASLAIVVVAAAVYLRPTEAPVSPPAALPSPAPGTQLDAVDFVTPTTGWVLEDLDDFQFAVLGTLDGGRHWRPELLQPTVQQGEYMRFFDAAHGVVATVGGEPLLFTTEDGGTRWTRHVVYDLSSFAFSASFTDPLHGWELIETGPDIPDAAPALVRTADGGRTWTRLGATVPIPAQPLAVVFADSMHGWLDTAGASPAAYASDDAGATWGAVTLPAPPGGWPVRSGSFFVAVQATSGGGVVASVVNYANVRQRSGLEVIAYPPLTVRTYDGGGPVIYQYATFVDAPTSGVEPSNRAAALQAANQTLERSTDGGATWTVVTPPSTDGTLGFAGPLAWWWIGPDEISSTADGGLTWEPVRIVNLPQPTEGSLVLVDSTHAWMSGSDRGTTVLYTTADGGDSWSSVVLPSLRL